MENRKQKKRDGSLTLLDRPVTDPSEAAAWLSTVPSRSGRFKLSFESVADPSYVLRIHPRLYMFVKKFQWLFYICFVKCSMFLFPPRQQINSGRPKSPIEGETLQKRTNKHMFQHAFLIKDIQFCKFEHLSA